jgi:hypothetical protein
MSFAPPEVFGPAQVNRTMPGGMMDDSGESDSECLYLLLLHFFQSTQSTMIPPDFSDMEVEGGYNYLEKD